MEQFIQPVEEQNNAQETPRPKERKVGLSDFPLLVAHRPPGYLGI